MQIKTAAAFRQQRLWAVKPLFPAALAMLIGLGMMFAGPVTPPASALTADIGPLKGHLDTTVSVGVSVRVEDRDPALVGQVNKGVAASANIDDGNLNFDPWDITSLNLKVLHEGSWSWENYSFFGRFYYFYDWAIMSLDPNFKAFTEQAQRRSGMNIVLLDAYLTGDYRVFGRPLSLRLGNHVLNWGESTFIQNGIASVNPFDVSALRVAGAELKEAVIPVPMISFIADLTGSLSLEGFYQFYWENTEIEPAGTYFSTSDSFGPGGSLALLSYGIAPWEDGRLTGPTDVPLQPLGTRPPTGSWWPRGPDREAKHMGQGGVALRYFASWLRGAELGAYYMRIHSRTPLASAITGNAPPQEQLDLLIWALLNGDYGSTAQIFREFPEDIDIVGVSMSAQGPFGVALQGEVSGRFGQPIQMHAVELSYAILSPLDDTLIALQGIPVDDLFRRSQIIQDQGPVGFNEYIRGWKRKDMMQVQATATKVFPPTLGTNQIVFLCEVGATYFFDLESKDQLRYEGPGTFTSGNSFFTNASLQPYTTKEGYADDFSWGYRLVTRLDFLNAIGPVNFLPSFAWSHDVHGTTPSPIGNFVEDRKAMTVALRFEYLQMISAVVSYNMFFGGGQRNLLHDRDFLSFSASMTF